MRYMLAGGPRTSGFEDDVSTGNEPFRRLSPDAVIIERGTLLFWRRNRITRTGYATPRALFTFRMRRSRGEMYM